MITSSFNCGATLNRGVTLNPAQREAVDAMHEFAAGAEPFFLLEGYAGTGKSTCVMTFVKEYEGAVTLTAPTNKATKVLRQLCDREGGVSTTSTIFSLLGLRLDSEGEVREVSAYEGGNRAGEYGIVVVDEAPMLNSKVWRYITQTAFDEGVKFLFMGDFAQLPPVGEKESPVASVTYKRVLTEVMRHDNQILTLATHLRMCQFRGDTLRVESDHDEAGGVYKLHWKKFREQACKAFTSENYAENPGSIKTVAWRNATVQNYNNIIRDAMYGEARAAESPFQIGERVVTTQPIMDMAGQELGTLMTTDEEGTVEQITVVQHPVYKDITCYRLEIDPEFGDGWVPAFVVHPRSEKDYNSMLNRLSQQAKETRRWREFWAAKELVHDIRPCHSITAHRAQGSTYETVFVDLADIMANRNRKEALQCLYVACTRPSRVLVICGG